MRIFNIDINEIISLITVLPSPFAEYVLILKIIFILVALLFIGAIIFFLSKSSWLNALLIEDMIEILTYRPLGVKKNVKTWKKIQSRIETGKESEYKLALIEADSLLGDVLEEKGFPGETLEKKLKQLDQITLPNVEQIREVHQIRNNIVHNPDYVLSLDETRKAMLIYEKALIDLQVL